MPCVGALTLTGSSIKQIERRWFYEDLNSLLLSDIPKI